MRYLAGLIGCLAVIATAGFAAAPDRQKARELYGATVDAARKLGNAPFDRPAARTLKRSLSDLADAFDFDSDSKASEALFNCSFGAKQLVAILSDADIERRPLAGSDDAKLMLERARDWNVEMRGCRRFLRLPDPKIDMEAISRRYLRRS